MAGLSEGSPAILCRYRITANTSPLQGENAGSIPATCSIVAVTVRHDIKFGEHGPLVVRCRMPTDSQKINRQTGAAPEGIRKSRHQSRMVLKNIGEDTAQNPPGLLPDGAGREVGFLAEG